MERCLDCPLTARAYCLGDRSDAGDILLISPWVNRNRGVLELEASQEFGMAVSALLLSAVAICPKTACFSWTRH